MACYSYLQIPDREIHKYILRKRNNHLVQENPADIPGNIQLGLTKSRELFLRDKMMVPALHQSRLNKDFYSKRLKNSPYSDIQIHRRILFHSAHTNF